MDDMQAFERQVADAFVRRAGPVRQVDAAAIFAGVSTRRSQGWGFGSLYSVSRLLVAGFVVALFGGVLFQGFLLAPQDDQDRDPAMPTASASPTVGGGSPFPTGTFVSQDDGRVLEFREDGTCVRAGTPCTFGTDGRLFAEMTFEDPSEVQVPAAYFWDFDGERLTFEAWGDDLQPDRLDTYTKHVYRPVGETVPLPPMETDLPIGGFYPNDGNTTQLRGSTQRSSTIWFNEGNYVGDDSGGWYVVNGDLATFTTNSGTTDMALVPATYRWRWDGERLTFQRWGEDHDRWRARQLGGRVFLQEDGEFIVLGPVRRLLLSSPRLEYFVTVEIQESEDGRYRATSSIDGEPLGEGVGGSQQEAARAALEPLGEPHVSELADGVTG